MIGFYGMGIIEKLADRARLGQRGQRGALRRAAGRGRLRSGPCGAGRGEARGHLPHAGELQKCRCCLRVDI